MSITATEGPYNSQEFFKSAIDAYGHDGAMLLGESIITNFAYAQDVLPLRRPISGVNLAVSEAVSSHSGVRAFARGSIVKLLFSPHAGVAQITGELAETICHEVGHVAHYQRIPKLHTSPADFLWSRAIREGVAIQAGYVLYGELASLLATSHWGDIRAEAALQELLDNPGGNQKARHYDFLMGDDDFRGRGYAIGHYAVESMREQYDMSLVELMETPLVDFTEFARRELV